MADEAEKKNIARLDFNISDATNSLEEVNRKLKEISNNSVKYASTIGEAMKKGLKTENLIDTKAIQNNLNNTTSLTEKNLQKINEKKAIYEAKASAKSKEIAQKEVSSINVIKEKEIANTKKTEEKKSLEVEKGVQKRLTEELKHANKMEEINARQLQSSKTLYDKIANYAAGALLAQGVQGLKQAASETIQEMVEVQYQMVEIDRVLNDNSINIDRYRDKLIQLAYDYGNSFENVSDVTLRLAKAGFDAQESIALTEKTLLALNTADLDATEATSNMIAVMSQFGKMTGDAAQEAKDYGDIIDKINKVADNFPTTSADILDALQKTGSAFSLAGATIDETIATIVAAEKSVQRGGKAIGTALSNIIQQLKAEKKLDLAEELGLNFYADTAKKEFKPIMEIFQELSNRMQSLKDEGKESSVEMQNLLEMFTVFRRNVGASLLGEMAGEESTYAQVLKASIDSVGYSLEENEKHMKTAKAAQAQFNAELLKLKTEVWDNGLEDVFRSFLKFGTDIVDGIQYLVKNIGLLPTAIGAVTLAFSLFSKTTRASTFLSITPKIKEIRSLLNQLNNQTINATKYQKQYNKIIADSSDSFKGYINSIGKNAQPTMKGYIGYLTTMTTKTILLTAKTILLQIAISGGITLAITGIITAIDNWVNATEKAIEKNKELKDQAEEKAKELNEEVLSIQDLTKQYNEFAKSVGKDGKKLVDEENISKALTLQNEINTAIKDSGKQIELVTETIDKQGNSVYKINKEYEEQLSILKEIAYEKKREELEQLKQAAESAEILKSGITGIEEGFWGNFFNTNSNELKKSLKEAGVSLDEFYEKTTETMNLTEKSMGSNAITIEGHLKKLTFDEQIKTLTEWKNALTKAELSGKDVSKALEIVESNLNKLKEQEKTATEATQKYKDALAELYQLSGQADKLTNFLESVTQSYNIEGPKKLIEDIQKINQKFSDGKIDIEEYFNKLEEKINDIDLSVQGEELEAYQAIFAGVTESLAEGISNLNAGIESGAINFADYSTGIKEAADNMFALREEQNNLTYDEVAGVWRDAGGNIDEYGTALYNAKEQLSGMSNLLKTIGDNYDYIAEHSNAAGEAMFKQADVGTKAYTDLANSVASSLQKMRKTNTDAYNAIRDKVYETMGDVANETANASNYMHNAFLKDADALNAALNEAANQVSLSTSKVTISMGNVLSELGNAISNFSYSITARPYITGTFGIHKDENGLPNGISLPSFGFDINGTGGESIKNLGSALNTFGSDLSELGNNQFRYTKLQSQVEPYKSTGSGGGSSGGSGSKGSKSSKSSSSDAEKAAEEAYKSRLEKYKASLSNMEDEEVRWVKKQNELGQLSNKDFIYITQERIKRYSSYLDKIKQMTWLNAEDRAALEKEYTQKIEDYQLEYFKYLKNILNEEIKALEDKRDEEIANLKQSNQEKITAIKEEAQARIDALKKVEKENDRIRAKEEYLENRSKHLDDISYWEQRTGREAQEALKEARKNLEKLDKEWQQKQEDWNLEDQIKAIEDERDAQIKAIEEAQEAQIKAIEKATQKEIEALQDVYDARVKLYSETNQIIFEEASIASDKLYQTYKENFIDKLTVDINKLISDLNKDAKGSSTSSGKSSSSNSSKQEYTNYKVKSGDTLSAIAAKYGTTVSKIMAANPSIKDKNLIYAGSTLKIPKFHEGGIVGGNKEGFALLKPKEVVLKPEWAEGINRLAKMAKQSNTNIVGPSTKVDVKGNLVNIEANVRNQTDINQMGKKIEKILEDKFNLKK